ncbi:phosphonate ABC transporter ATP-binding protein [Rhodovulum strictum]|uniref:ATP-binding cassette domain-containing protein n=1 Tax=Rhodovulum strictum TaxID=58314 RepID=A0A844BJZ4_9RHOB|nr:ATP-binding cassette domain-containing protein [Rhodovulum strictum]MRH21342.1 ATP-binding cassette domain-containing protein [Rhodovulum strictum]
MLDLSPARPSTARGALSDPIVTTGGLRKSYDRKTEILKGIDLTIRAGERVALIGSNGCGKSTLLRCLIGLHEVSAGEVTALGETFTGLPAGAQKARLRRKTGFVFQKHCLVRRRSVLSNVIHGMMSEPGSWRAFSQMTAPETWRRAALEALAWVNLADKAAARADALSGGQQQRVAIARALVRQPALLIADEPAASLDPVSGQDVMALFTRLCAEHGITLLFTSHDMSHARSFADRIVALKAGRVLFDKPADTTTDADIEEVFRVEAR